MQRYLLQRLILFVPTLAGVMVAIFALLRLAPGDFADAFLRDEPQVTDEMRAAVRHQFGLDRPLVIQFADWAGSVARGDFGRSFWYKQPVTAVLAERFPTTLELAGMSMILGMTIGITVGVVSALKQDQTLDYLARLFVIGGLSLPDFFASLILLYALLRYFKWSPPLGYSTVVDDLAQNLLHLIWPALILAYGTAAPIARMTRSQLLEVLRLDYIRTARAKGLRERVVVGRHALQNAVLPVITLAGVTVGRLLSGVVVVETIFTVPGMGRALLVAVQNRDYPLAQGLILYFALIFMVVNLVVDLLYGWLDPRVRY